MLNISLHCFPVIGHNLKTELLLPFTADQSDDLLFLLWNREAFGSLIDPFLQTVRYCEKPKPERKYSHRSSSKECLYPVSSHNSWEYAHQKLNKNVYSDLYQSGGTLKPTVPNFWVKMYTILPAQLKVQFPEPVVQNRISLLFVFTAFDLCKWTWSQPWALHIQ